MTTSFVELAQQLATEAHSGQTRRDGSPYIEHPRRVASHMVSDYARAVAWLHDALEDAKDIDRVRKTLGNLHDEGRMPSQIILSVLVLTKRKDEDYRAYLKRVKLDALATSVKIADILDNLSDAPTPAQVKRYAEGLAFLLDLEAQP